MYGGGVKRVASNTNSNAAKEAGHLRTTFAVNRVEERGGTVAVGAHRIPRRGHFPRPINATAIRYGGPRETLVGCTRGAAGCVAKIAHATAVAISGTTPAPKRNARRRRSNGKIRHVIDGHGACTVIHC